MPNPQNLTPNSERTPIERQEIARKGGIASGAVRRQRRSMRETLEELLQLPLRDGALSEELTSFAALAANQKNITVEQALLIKQIALALQGNTKAATFVRDTAGQKILKDAADNNTEYEDDGFTEAIIRSSEGVWR